MYMEGGIFEGNISTYVGLDITNEGHCSKRRSEGALLKYMWNVNRDNYLQSMCNVRKEDFPLNLCAMLARRTSL